MSTITTLSTLRRSARQSTNFTHDATFNTDTILSSNQSSASVLSSSESSSDNCQNNDIIPTKTRNVKSKVTIQSLASSNSSDHSDTNSVVASSSNVIHKRKEVPQRKNVKKRKIDESFTNNSTRISTITYESDTDDDQSIELRSSKTSSVWQYATRIDKNFSQCDLCDKRISTSNWSTTYLRQHLIEKHNKTDLILPHTQKNNKCKIVKNVRNKLHQLAVEAVIRDGLPFNVFKKPGLSKLLEEAMPGYRPPHRNHITRHIKRLERHHRSQLFEQLKSVDNISIITDFWCNRSNRCFIVITGHYYKPDHELKSQVLDFSSFDQRHTSSQIGKLITCKLRKLNILHKISRIVCDGAPNLTNAIDKMNISAKRIWCIAHRLHLVLTNGLALWPKKSNNADSSGNDEEPEYSNMNVDNDAMLNMNDDTLQNQPESEDEAIDQQKSEDEEGMDDSEEEGEKEDDGEEEEEKEDDSTNSIIVEDEFVCTNDDDILTDNWEENVETDSFDPSLLLHQKTILSLMKKCRTLLTMIKKSTTLTMYMVRERNKANIKRSVIPDVCSRWNSTFVMIDSLKELRPIFEKLFNDKHHLNIKHQQIEKLNQLEISSADWNHLNQLHDVLKIFFQSTELLSGKNYPTIGLAYFLISRLKMFLIKDKDDNAFVKRLKKSILSKMAFYFDQDVDQSDLLKFHSYLDPDGFRALSDVEKRTIELEIKQMFADNLLDMDHSPSTLSAQDSPNFSNTAATTTTTSHGANKLLTSKSNNNRKSTAMEAFLNAVGDDTVPKNNSSQRSTIAEELYNYRLLVTKFNSKREPSTSSSSNFWKSYSMNFPYLWQLAKQLLCTPATSVPSESAFSMSSYLARKERARLSGENLAASIFLKVSSKTSY
ncbi:unnamed protein product [Rotaria sp. Silwood2]|nr:unnamed protein product [Rotaria sp. Silwood2]CAF2931533.1 unnamed protein product [Rotaria sp. Silwood2]CAF3409421.1 unnamed protein product [Rotaria sp. Silwood2]CAF4424391.1 unnamed protein product [Rotaria sp. Silwood2]CAF4462642.1 unnamed protein product [Rotaria sp. Silwood2]